MTKYEPLRLALFVFGILATIWAAAAVFDSVTKFAAGLVLAFAAFAAQGVLAWFDS